MRLPYRDLLVDPRIRAQAAAGLLAQVSQGAAGVGIVLVVRAATGSLAVAGAATAAFTVALGIARPLQGRRIDRRGPAGLLAVSGVLHAAAFLALVLLAHARAPGAVLVAAAAPAGASLPLLSAPMRVLWGARDVDRRAAYGLVTLCQQVAVLGGPLVLAALIAAASPGAALAIVAALSGVGSIAFAASVRDEGGDASSGAGDEGDDASLRAADEGSRPRHPLAARGLRALVAIHALIGATIGAIEVGAAALAVARGRPAAAGLLLAALSVGGVAGGLGYGVRSWAARVEAQLAAALAVVTIAVVPLALGAGLAAAAALLLVAGLPLNPALTGVMLLLDRHAPARGNEAFGWLSTALAAGTAAGSALAGAAAQSGSAREAFLVAAVAAGLAAAGALAALRRSGARPAR